MNLKISEVAKLTGVTVRTLHYYDKIGLLKPSKITEANYRLYSEDSLERLQQILFFRELDFPLCEIKAIMENPNYDKSVALRNQKDLLLQKRQRIDQLVQLIDRTMKGEEKMSFQEFDQSGFEETKKKYAEEVKQRWGTTDAYRESEEKTKHYSKNQWNEINDGVNKILEKFGEYNTNGKKPEEKEVQELVREWQAYITTNFYQCTDEILGSLGMMYVADERFKKNIDKNGTGTAEFLSKAIEIYCNN